jgi:hypothetical protein
VRGRKDEEEERMKAEGRRGRKDEGGRMKDEFKILP